MFFTSSMDLKQIHVFQTISSFMIYNQPFIRQTLGGFACGLHFMPLVEQVDIEKARRYCIELFSFLKGNGVEP